MTLKEIKELEEKLGWDLNDFEIDKLEVVKKWNEIGLTCEEITTYLSQNLTVREMNVLTKLYESCNKIKTEYETILKIKERIYNHFKSNLGNRSFILEDDLLRRYVEHAFRLINSYAYHINIPLEDIQTNLTIRIGWED